MKKIFTLLATFVFVANAFAQPPEKITYQAVIRNSSGNLVISTTVGIRIHILQNTETSDAVYIETHTATTNANGLVTLEIGGGTVVTGTFAGIDWSAGPYFLKTETDPSGGTNYTITGTCQILSVPYALYAKTAENGFSGNYDDLTHIPAFADVAFSGSYSDLSDTPAIDTINDDTTSTTSLWSSTKTSTELGDKADIADIYTKTNLQTSGQAIVHYNNLNNKPVNLDEDKSDDVSLTGNQTITGNKTFTGSITVPDPVYAGDATTKEYVDALREELNLMKELAFDTYVYDIDGNIYKTVTIGTQVWMAENLRTTRFNDGTSIPLVTDNNAWESLTSPGRCYYDNDSLAYKNIYGALYNCFAVTDKLCPAGWHVGGWPTLLLYLGADLSGGEVVIDTIAADKMREVGTSHWHSPNAGATNESGFTALPVGCRGRQGGFGGIGTDCTWWDGGPTLFHGELFWIGWSWTIRYDGYLQNGWTFPNCGFSVRCLKD